MAIARSPSVVIDCPDATVLARFYGALLDWPVSTGADDQDTWQEIRGEGQVICFQQVEDYRAGKERAFNSLVGQVMKATQGKANPAQVAAILKRRLGA